MVFTHFHELQSYLTAILYHMLPAGTQINDAITPASILFQQGANT